MEWIYCLPSIADAAHTSPSSLPSKQSTALSHSQYSGMQQAWSVCAVAHLNSSGLQSQAFCSFPKIITHGPSTWTWTIKSMSVFDGNDYVDLKKNFFSCLQTLKAFGHCLAWKTNFVEYTCTIWLPLTKLCLLWVWDESNDQNSIYQSFGLQ